MKPEPKEGSKASGVEDSSQTSGKPGSPETSKPSPYSSVFEDVLRDEVEQIHGSRIETHETPLPKKPTNAFIAAHEKDLTGLAFSGGGIRSATFNLGVIQALSHFKTGDSDPKSLMSRFDYLSTVSGGGYIGSWFSAWLHRESVSKEKDATEEFLNDMSSEFSAHPTLREGQAHSEVREGKGSEKTSGFVPLEHESIRFLRRYSNYLTPRLGLSGDMLALVSIFLRNFVLMQLALVSFLMSVLLVFYFIAALSVKIIHSEHLLFGIELQQLTVGVGVLALFGVLCFFGFQIAGVPTDKIIPDTSDDLPVDGSAVARRNGAVVVFSLFASWLIVISATATDGVAPLLNYLGIGVAGYWFAWGIGHGAYLIGMGKIGGKSPGFNRAEKVKSLLSITIAGAVFGLLAYVCASALNTPWASAQSNTLAVIAFGPPAVLLVASFVITMHIGTAGSMFSEMHREWWARIGGYVLFAMLVWVVVCLITYYAAPLLRQLGNGGFAAFATWAGATGAGALFARNASPEGRGGMGAGIKKFVLRVAPWLFLFGMAALVSFALNAIFLTATGGWQDWPTEFSFGKAVAIATTELRSASMLHSFGALMMSLLVFAFVTYGLDINIFSAHSMYKNRLTRAYLGASSGRTRYEHPFTGFSSTDDLPMEVLAGQRPIHIVNTTVNMTGGDDLAWQTRRAASFSFTPKYVGYEAKNSTGTYIGGYRPTRYYTSDVNPQDEKPVAEQAENAPDTAKAGGEKDDEVLVAQDSEVSKKVEPEKKKKKKVAAIGGVELGTAVAISGAAASPNMGYHTAPTVAALLTAFNLRLGFWGGNTSDLPERKKHKPRTSWWKKHPMFAGIPILAELTGSANAKYDWINLSDGGHFDNLGIYELVRRRCRFIVVTDAGCDPEHQFDDLANATRKCWTDFGVHITFPDIDEVSLKKGSGRFTQRHATLGSITYPQFKKEDPRRYGLILYIKSSIVEHENRRYVDIRQYANANSDFPHETTADQFFDENQFEAYRHLGYCVIDHCKRDIQRFFDSETGYINRAKVHAAAEKLCAKGGGLRKHGTGIEPSRLNEEQ